MKLTPRLLAWRLEEWQGHGKNRAIVMGGWCGKVGDESRYYELHCDKLHLRGVVLVGSVDSGKSEILEMCVKHSVIAGNKLGCC